MVASVVHISNFNHLSGSARLAYIGYKGMSNLKRHQASELAASISLHLVEDKTSCELFVKSQHLGSWEH